MNEQSGILSEEIEKLIGTYFYLKQDKYVPRENSPLGDFFQNIENKFISLDQNGKFTLISILSNHLCHFCHPYIQFRILEKMIITILYSFPESLNFGNISNFLENCFSIYNYYLENTLSEPLENQAIFAKDFLNLLQRIFSQLMSLIEYNSNNFNSDNGRKLASEIVFSVLELLRCEILPNLMENDILQEVLKAFKNFYFQAITSDLIQFNEQICLAKNLIEMLQKFNNAEITNSLLYVLTIIKYNINPEVLQQLCERIINIFFSDQFLINCNISQSFYDLYENESSNRYLSFRVLYAILQDNLQYLIFFLNYLKDASNISLKYFYLANFLEYCDFHVFPPQLINGFFQQALGSLDKLEIEPATDILYFIFSCSKLEFFQEQIFSSDFFERIRKKIESLSQLSPFFTLSMKLLNTALLKKPESEFLNIFQPFLTRDYFSQEGFPLHDAISILFEFLNQSIPIGNWEIFFDLFDFLSERMLNFLEEQLNLYCQSLLYFSACFERFFNGPIVEWLNIFNGFCICLYRLFDGNHDIFTDFSLSSNIIKTFDKMIKLPNYKMKCENDLINYYQDIQTNAQIIERIIVQINSQINAYFPKCQNISNSPNDSFPQTFLTEFIKCIESELGGFSHIIFLLIQMITSEGICALVNDISEIIDLFEKILDISSNTKLRFYFMIFLAPIFSEENILDFESHIPKVLNFFYEYSFYLENDDIKYISYLINIFNIDFDQGFDEYLDRDFSVMFIYSLVFMVVSSVFDQDEQIKDKKQILYDLIKDDRYINYLNNFSKDKIALKIAQRFKQKYDSNGC